MRRRLALAVLAAAVLVSCSSGKKEGSPTTTLPFLELPTTSVVPVTPVVAKLLSPTQGSVQGSGGRGMVVVLTFATKDPSVLAAQFRLGGALPPPAVAVKPGHNPAFPGLVVGLSTTATSLGGPTANLANLFQIVSPSKEVDGSTQVSAVWTNAQAIFGSDTDVTLVAFTVSGTAPDVISQVTDTTVNSNAVQVSFRISAAGQAVTEPTSSTSAPKASTTSVKPTTSTTKPTTTTMAPTTTKPSTTTTVPPTTTTTKLLGLF